MDADPRLAPARWPPPPLRIGPVTVDPPLVLAPMAGVGDRHFRRLVRRFGGVGLVVTEFALAEPLASGSPRAVSKLRFDEEERPVAVQLLGRDPEAMARAAAAAQRLEPDVCDLNLGCPMRKITRRGAGAALMDRPEEAARVIEACRRELSIPLTVKCRLGARAGAASEAYLEIGRIAEQLGVAAITLHPRHGRALYTGAADWAHVARLKRAVGIPVIGNGDVQRAADAARLPGRVGCDGVMIGRAAIARPWIFRQVAALWAGQPPADAEAPGDRRELLGGLEAVAASEPPAVALHKLRSFAGRYAAETGGSEDLRCGLARARTSDQVLELMRRELFERRAGTAHRGQDDRGVTGEVPR